MGNQGVFLLWLSNNSWFIENNIQYNVNTARSKQATVKYLSKGKHMVIKGTYIKKWLL